MADDALVATLGNVDLFQGLPQRVLAHIAESGHVARYEAGATVIAEGAPVAGFAAFSPAGVELHVILEGRARVEVRGVVHAVLGPGRYFGEISLIDGKPRSADVVAEEGGLRTLALSKWAFEDLLEKHPEVAIPMLRVLAGRLRAQESAG